MKTLKKSRVRTFYALALLPFLLGAIEAHAQQQLSPFGSKQPTDTTATQQPQSQSTQVGNVSTGDYSGLLSEQSNKIFDVDSDMINPGEGIMNWKGKIFNVEDTKIFRESFERYLSTPAPQKSTKKDYEKLLKKIQKLLTQQEIKQKDVNQKMVEAMSLLLEASTYEADEMQSLTLANQVYKSCRQRAELHDLQVWQKMLEDEKSKLQVQLSGHENLRRKREAESQHNLATGSAGKKGGKASMQSSAGKVEASPQQTFITERLAENKAAIASASAQKDTVNFQAKLEFQTTMVTFLTMRHYNHALLSSAFYRVLFKGSQHGLESAKSEFLSEIGISGVVPSLETFDQIAREMQSETSKYVKAADFNWDSGQKYHAMRQMIYAYFIGQHELDVIYYPQEKKTQFFKLWLELREIARQSENRDLGEIELSLARVKAVAPDFPAAEISGKVSAAKRASNLEIMRARQVALTAGAEGTPEAMKAATDEVELHLQKAAEYWPQNPGLTSFMEELLGRADVMAQLAPEFDRLVSQKKYREIFNRRAEFTAALMQDAGRRKRLEEISTYIMGIESLLSQVKVLKARGDNYIAWDTLLVAERIDPNDDNVIKEKSALVDLVAEYSRLLAQAQQDESKRDFPSALNRYIAAQDLNPASEICRKAIARIAERILTGVSPADAEFVPQPKRRRVKSEDIVSEDESAQKASSDNASDEVDDNDEEEEGNEWDF